MGRLPHLWVGVWFCGLVDGWVFLLTFDCLLKAPQPITGLFLTFDFLLKLPQPAAGLFFTAWCMSGPRSLPRWMGWYVQGVG